MAFDEKALPPIPYKVQVLTAQGFISEPWAKFLRQLFNRAGGTIALSNVELAELQEADLASIVADINSLTSSLSGLTTTVSTLGDSVTNLQTSINDLKQGRQL